MSKGNILLHITGSISCFKACALVSAVVKDGYEAQVTATESALKFVGTATFEGLTGRPVLTDVFAGTPDFHPHITLAQHWADILLVYPASADSINRMAAGLADDLFGALFLANNFRKPVWIAPAMNTEMLNHPAVQESLKKLSGWGAVILPSGEGRMSCGAEGVGRLLEPEECLARIKAAL